jgi:hypothetical protein
LGDSDVVWAIPLMGRKMPSATAETERNCLKLFMTTSRARVEKCLLICLADQQDVGEVTQSPCILDEAAWFYFLLT